VRGAPPSFDCAAVPVRPMRDHVRVARIHENGPPIRVDDAARSRLRDALDRDGVVSASLFGSQAAGTAGALSDVDIAVWLDPELSDSERFRLRLELIGRAASALGTNEVDLVVLNDAPPLLKHRALSSRALLVDRDAVRRLRLESRAVAEYLDTKPLRDRLTRAMRGRLAEGRFGRR
jgi:predicted nucleotidyltransferase